MREIIMFKSIVTVAGSEPVVTEHASTEAAWLKCAEAFGKKWDDAAQDQGMDDFKKWSTEDDRILMTPPTAESFKIEFADFVGLTVEVQPV
jgi:hypothetical protein